MSEFPEEIEERLGWSMNSALDAREKVKPGVYINQSVADAAMDYFEAFVLAQKPAAEPWKPVTDYSFEARKEIEGRHPDLILEVFKPTVVVDVGCGPDAILVRLLKERGLHQTIGLDPQIVESPFSDRSLIRGSISDRDFCKNGTEPWADLVICREVLEHLTLIEIRRAISNMCAMSSRMVYITTRFSSEHDILRVEGADCLDPTHITIASKALYRLLLNLEGFIARPHLEERMDWQNKGRCLVYERVTHG